MTRHLSIGQRALLLGALAAMGAEVKPPGNAEKTPLSRNRLEDERAQQRADDDGMPGYSGCLKQMGEGR